MNLCFRLWRLSTWGRCGSTHFSPSFSCEYMNVECSFSMYKTLFGWNEMLRHSKFHDSSLSFSLDPFPASFAHLALFCPPAAPSLLDTAQIRGRTAGGARRNASLGMNPFISLAHKLDLRAHQRAPIEPLKPLFPDMKEGNQNREIRRKARSQRSGVWSACSGASLRGVHFPYGVRRPLCPLEV